MKIKNILKLFGVALFIGALAYAWQVHVNYRFEEISKDKVYKSALIAPDKLEGFLVNNHIKTVINLLEPTIQDELNPANQADIDAEDRAITAVNQKHNLQIRHINIPSGQIPTKKTLTRFFEVLDNPESYPVLIHCYHGTGRAQIYSQIYRIEYENWKNEDARAKTRFIVEMPGYKSSFADGKGKGDFLMGYIPRRAGSDATINTLKN
jgi:protein tyrosine phosphatase (PTP) superfamily phosphohydrolase (DUF442 family)